MSENTVEHQGVETLIARIREKGVAKAREEAEAILTQAKSEAEEIRRQAQTDAKTTLETAEREINRRSAAAHAALQKAARDVVLQLQSDLMSHVHRFLARAVESQLNDPSAINDMIAEMVRRIGHEIPIPESHESTVAFQLPRRLFSNPEAPTSEATWKQCTLAIARHLVDSGLPLLRNANGDESIRLASPRDGREILISTESVTTLLLQFIAPHFRDVLAGPDVTARQDGRVDADTQQR
jgi:F0F1-type ATP synthase membrane subunit b/b'